MCKYQVAAPGTTVSQTRSGLRARLWPCGWLSLMAWVLWCSAPAAGQCTTGRIANPDPDAGAWQQMALAADGDVLVVGAMFQWCEGIRGAVQVLRRTTSGWDWEAELGMSENLPGGCDFGMSVAVSGDVLAVGAPCAVPDDPGAVWVYEKQDSEWVTTATLTPPVPAEVALFGFSVTVSGNVIAVGAPEAVFDPEGSDPPLGGAVLIYHRLGADWLYSETLRPFDCEWDDRFGSAVSLSGGKLAVGAPNHDNGNGAVFLFEHLPAGWVGSEFFPLYGTDAAYGSSVALYQDNLVIGAPGVNIARIARWDGSWSGQDFSPDYTGGSFGTCVAVNGDFAFVGQPDAQTESPVQGLAYVYGRVGSDWQLETYIRPEDYAFGFAGFATSVAASDTWGAVANPWGYASGVPLAGSADFVLLEGPDCDGNGQIDECELLAGTATDCNGNGVIDLCEVLSGAAADCDGDEIPDECECYAIDDSSAFMSPFGAGSPKSFTLAAAPRAATDVELEFRAAADLGGVTEWVDVELNGVSVGRVFMLTGSDCADWDDFDVDALFLSAEDFNALVPAGQDAVIRMVASGAVDPELCGIVGDADSAIEVTIRYAGLGPGDCDGNGVPDICDVLAGELVDSDGDGVPDICDDDPIRGDTNCDGAVNAFDIDPFVLALTDSAGYGQQFPACSPLSADCNADGLVNAFDIDPFVGLLVGGA